MTLLAVGVAVVAAAVLLSDRAPGVVADVSEQVSTRLDRRAPAAGVRARRAVARTGIEERDTWAHLAIWGSATLFAGLASWSWRSLAVVVALLVAGSTALELLQEELAPSRITEWSDVAANLAGIAIGLAAVIAIASLSGAPALLRRWRRPRPSPAPG